MKTKKLIVTLSLMVLVSSVPSKSVFAASPISMDILNSKTEISRSPSDFEFKTPDNQLVKIPDEIITPKFNKENNAQVNSDVESGYDKVKVVAEQIAPKLLAQPDPLKSTSVQYALIDNGKIVLSGNAGVYSKDSNESLTADNMYGIGSVSKIFVTTAVMKLVDQGKIDLDAPVTKYIKDFKMADDRYKKITVRMLLNHSSGLMGTCYNNTMLFNDNDTYAHDTLLSQLKTQRLKAEPGAYSVYCNDGFSLAEILVERVAGDSYTNYITKNITNPLKMNNTKTPVSKFDRDKLVKTYYPDIQNALPVDNLDIIGAGGLYSSAEDLCKFATTFTNNSNKILSDNSLKAMENKEYLRGIWPAGEESELSYGLGWDNVNLYPFNRFNIKALEKSGDTNLYHSSLVVLPEKNMAMAVVSSGGTGGNDTWLAEQILLVALKEKGDLGNETLPNTNIPLEKVAVPSELKQYEGLYMSPKRELGFIDVKIDESGTLSYSNPENPDSEVTTLTYTKDGTFKTSDGSKSYKFVKESNGKIYIQKTMYGGIGVQNSYVAQKKEANNIPENISKAWEKRAEKAYFLVNEKYSSQAYMTESPSPIQTFRFIKGFEGYVSFNKIVDENTAVPILDVPGVISRDQSDYKFYNKDNHEYFTAGGYTFVDDSAVSTLPTEDKFTCKIGKEGYAQWYTIGDESANKEITINVPKDAAFVVYDNNAKLIEDSVISRDNKVTLPKGGLIVFVGSAKAKFNIKYN
ncbi:beta-lactamase family protein [Clostridium sp. SHJSY1]|uniref:serine hydrolase domain-containing protein n=1 Tax=Clostridium sp. SHJSY1 TaxID=2942483 RepID=UPI0028743061|nr:serine hydrolase domain-containing protein [Clostridium sp. SHJSY1]MDS0528547.1 beta-lactamase family protein [Clostridium sp. SHJSY1]